MNEPQILKGDQISNETQITNKPLIIKEHQISKKLKLQMNP
jgi:hypothetical protein